MKVVFGFVDYEWSGRVWLKEELVAQAFESADEVAAVLVGAKGNQMAIRCRSEDTSQTQMDPP